MSPNSPEVCPHCGKPIRGKERNNLDSPNNPAGETDKTPGREYDHRGIAMPRRTRMGGIIIPQ